MIKMRKSNREPDPKYPDKNRGWRIVGPVDDVVEGRTVTVTKSDGSTKDVVVGAVYSKPFPDKFDDSPNYGKMLVWADFVETEAAASQARAKPFTCPQCGYKTGDPIKKVLFQESPGVTDDLSKEDDIQF